MCFKAQDGESNQWFRPGPQVKSHKRDHRLFCGGTSSHEATLKGMFQGDGQYGCVSLIMSFKMILGNSGETN